MVLGASRLLAARRQVQAAPRTYDYDFTRNSLTYSSYGRVANLNVPRFEPGKFGQAVMVEEKTTNLLKNAGFEYDSNNDGLPDGWSWWIRQPNTTSITWTLDSTKTCGGGQFSQKAHCVLNNYSGPFPEFGSISQTFTIGENQPLSKQVYVYTDNSHFAVTVRFWFFGQEISVHDTILPYDQAYRWHRLTGSITTPSGTASVRFEIYYRSRVSTASGNIWVDTAQVENKSYSTTPIFAADATTQAVRAAEFLTIPTAGVLNPQEGTVEFWVKLDTLKPGAPPSQCYSAMFTSGDVPAPGPRILIMRDTDNKITVWDGDGSTEDILKDSTAMQAGTWYYVAFTWSASGRKLYVNGQLKASNTRTANLGFASLARIGTWEYPGVQEHLNGLIDDLRISNRARTGDEVAAAYASDAPLPVDQYTTKKLSFDMIEAA